MARELVTKLSRNLSHALLVSPRRMGKSSYFPEAFTAPLVIGQASTQQFWDDAHSILSCDKFRVKASSFDRRGLIQRGDAIGGPQMLLLHSKRIEELGRIPHYDEQMATAAVRGIEEFGAQIVEVIMISHKWLRPSADPHLAHPDTEDNAKAIAINEFSKWRREWVSSRHGFIPEIYYWIDYSCVDQSNSADAIPLLPLWTACCERFLQIESEGYDDRAWCRLERMLSYVYSFADHHISISLNFRCSWPSTGTEVKKLILDPSEGATTDPNDLPYLKRLAVLAANTQPANTSQAKVTSGRTFVKCFQL